jgi:ribonuclease-3
LGDAILDAIVADIVYQHFDGKREGFLTNTRSKIVQRETLNKLAVEIGLDKLIKSAARSSSHNSYMYGNAFEAFIGAIYMDRGYKRCKTFVEEKIITPYIDLDKLSRKEVNFKSKLIEWSQKNKVEVSFELIEQFLDQESNPVFQTEVLIERVSAGSGAGYSKKESQQNAAQMALKKIKSNPDFLASIEEAKALLNAVAEEEMPVEEVLEEELLEEDSKEGLEIEKNTEAKIEEVASKEETSSILTETDPHTPALNN